MSIRDQMIKEKNDFYHRLFFIYVG